MTVILGGKELAAVYAAGVANGTGGKSAVLSFHELIRELSGEDPEYGDSVEFNLGRVNEGIGDIFDVRKTGDGGREPLR